MPPKRLRVDGGALVAPDVYLVGNLHARISSPRFAATPTFTPTTPEHAASFFRIAYSFRAQRSAYGRGERRIWHATSL